MNEQPSPHSLLSENEDLRARLAEAEELIRAIRTGEVDALAVQGPQGPRIFTLQGADQIYRTLIEKMNEGAVTLDHNGTILYSNLYFAQLLKLPLQEVMGSSFFDFIPDEFRQYFDELFQMGWEGISKGEVPLQYKSGAFTPFSLSMTVLNTGEAHVLGMIITDLSPQKEIQAIQALAHKQNAIIEQNTQELRRQETAQKEAQQMWLILESLPQIAWTASPEGKNMYFNQQWYTYSGTNREENSDLGITSFLHPDDVTAAQERWNDAVANGQPYEMEYRILRASDEMYRWMLGRALALKDESGQVTLWVGTCTDIHDQRLVLEELALAKQALHIRNQELSKTNVDLDNFVYTASHDLKSPVTTLDGLLGLLSRRLFSKMDETDQKMMRMVQASTTKLLRTIRDLTEITKLQKDGELEKETVLFGELIQDIQSDIATLLLEANAQLTTSFEVEEITYARKNLRSILYNLLSNALKYRSPQRAPQIHISTSNTTGVPVLEVKDNGLGLEPEQVTKLFTMFKRFHTHVDGTGIGLYMIKRIVENNGGRIEVESKENEGTIFKVYFSQALPIAEGISKPLLSK